MVEYLRKLGQRKIAQWALAYAAGAWVALQAVSLAAGSYGWSAQVMRIGIGVAAIGFLATVILAWYHGERGEQKASTAELLILAALLTVGGGVMWRSERATPAPGPAKASSAALAPASLTLGVAVLPFTNMSPDPNNAFFAGGVFEEVLTKLSQVPALRVISRTSMEQIAKQNLEVRAIGRRLGVSHVLEGSVRREGNQVRVTVQLIEAATDNHVWAENYDRKLDDVFAIQSEIALAIADQLKLTLTPKLQSDLSLRPTQNQAAYDAYLRAKEEQRGWRGAAGFRTMIGLLEPAVRADPEFVAAKVLLAEAYGRLYWTGEGDDRDVAKASALVADIGQRWPQRPESVLAQAQFLYNVRRDYPAALVKFRQVQAQMPSDLGVALGISSALKRLDRHAEFLEASLRLQQLDPESTNGYFERMYALFVNGRADEAIALGQQATQKFPGEGTIAGLLARIETDSRRDPKPMLEFGRQFDGQLEGDDLVVRARFATGDVDGALAAAGSRTTEDPLAQAFAQAWQADLLQLAGRSAEARPLARRAFATVQAAVTAGRPPPLGQVASWYAGAAGVAVLAGEPTVAAAWEAKARATPATSMEEQKWVDAGLADLQRLRGNTAAAWALRTHQIGTFGDLSDGQLIAFQPFYDKMFGAAPAYRAYIANIRARR